jgi:VCBS repeat-containing protein
VSSTHSPWRRRHFAALQLLALSAAALAIVVAPAAAKPVSGVRVTVTTAPASVATGGGHTLPLTVTLTNKATNRKSKPGVLRVYLSTDHAADRGILLGQSKEAAIAKRRTRVAKLSEVVPATLKSGTTYRVLAVLDSATTRCVAKTPCNRSGAGVATALTAIGTPALVTRVPTGTVSGVIPTLGTSGGSYATNEDTPVAMRLIGSGYRGDPIDFIVDHAPAHGTLSGLFPNIIYTPNLNYNGVDSFTFHVRDFPDDSNISTVTLQVAPVVDPPVAIADQYTPAKNQVFTRTAITGVLHNDQEVDGHTLTAALTVGPSNGALVFNADGSFTYTPSPDYTGNDSFSYAISDGSLVSPPATVTLAVTNNPPVTIRDGYSTPQDTVLSRSADQGLLANDADPNGDTFTASVGTPPGHGTISLADDGSFVYTPTSDFTGTDSFTYRAVDAGSAMSSITTVTINVGLVNHVPVANSESYSTPAGAALTEPFGTGVLANDTDLDNDSLTATLVTPPAHGTLTFNANGSFIYTPAAGYQGSDSFTYRDSDGQALSPSVGTALITVS